MHRKLDELREGGLIEQTFEGKNRRTKFLVPTKAANVYFDRMLQPIGFKNQPTASKDAENDGEQVEKTIPSYRRQA